MRLFNALVGIALGALAYQHVTGAHAHGSRGDCCKEFYSGRESLVTITKSGGIKFHWQVYGAEAFDAKSANGNEAREAKAENAPAKPMRGDVRAMPFGQWEAMQKAHGSIAK